MHSLLGGAPRDPIAKEKHLLGAEAAVKASAAGPSRD